MRPLQLFLVLVVIAGSGAACAKARANTEPPMPVLLPPPPPPRIVEALDDPVPTIEPSPVDTALATPPARPPVRPAAPRTEPPKPDPEPARAEPERVVANAPSLTLKPGPGMEAKTQASIRGLLDRAMRDLQKVNFPALDADGRAQYDIARRFMQQAEDAIKSANLAFAGKLADKAATMAAVLVR